MTRRRPVLSIPGQSGTIDVRGSRYDIRRRRDRIFVHGNRVRGRKIGVKGSTTHVHVHSGRRPRPRASPPKRFIDLEGRKAMVEELIAARRGIMFGDNTQRGLLNAPASDIEKAVAEFRKETHPIRAVFSDWKPWVFNNDNRKLSAFYYHPVTTIEKLGEGITNPRYKRVRKHRANLVKIRDAYARVEAEKRGNQIMENYEKRLAGTLGDFKQNGRVGMFERHLEQADEQFRRDSAVLLMDYMAAKKGAKKMPSEEIASLRAKLAPRKKAA